MIICLQFKKEINEEINEEAEEINEAYPLEPFHGASPENSSMFDVSPRHCYCCLSW